MYVLIVYKIVFTYIYVLIVCKIVLHYFNHVCFMSTATHVTAYIQIVRYPSHTIPKQASQKQVTSILCNFFHH